MREAKLEKVKEALSVLSRNLDLFRRQRTIEMFEQSERMSRLCWSVTLLTLERMN